MANHPLPPSSALRQLLDYDTTTGKLVWRLRDVAWFQDGKRPALTACKRWNSRYAGKEAFTSRDSDGYLQGAIFNRRRLAHRVIWAWATGDWPEAEVDHINGIRDDNRLANLRVVTGADNRKNSKKQRNNTTGFAGVYKDRAGRWFARVQSNGVAYNLGRFDHYEEAVAARIEGLAKYGFHPNHGRT